MEGRIPRPLARNRVDVEHASTLDAEGLDGPQVVERVHAEELRAARRRRLAPVEPEVAVGLQLGLDRPQP